MDRVPKITNLNAWNLCPWQPFDGFANENTITNAGSTSTNTSQQSEITQASDTTQATQATNTIQASNVNQESMH